RAGWTFVAPQAVVLLLFVVVPMLMALWVSVSDWSGRGSPFSAGVNFVGLENYDTVIGSDGLARTDLMTSLRNNFYYVLIVVPAQTLVALGLALVLNSPVLRLRGFFRTSFYFPAVTSSVAISVVFIFLFTDSGSVNAVLGLVGIDGPAWLADARGTLHLLLGAVGVSEPPAALAGTEVMGLSLWDWMAGPSVAMCTLIFLVTWVTIGPYKLMFLAALQDVPRELEEAATIDGASRWQTIRRVVVPSIRPTVVLVVTLGLIGTWQVFDQVYVISKGDPGKTTLTPAYLSYDQSFNATGTNHWGEGAAIAFLLFALIVVLAALQRVLTRDRKDR
ncbi:MAG: sugar ABC transporter permease, partial [Pseudonocardia sediminis]